jgi:hypothetical protein
MWHEWGKKRNICWVCWGKLKEGDYLQDRLKYTNNINIHVDVEERNRVGEHGLD